MISGFGTEVSPIKSVVASEHDSNRPAVTSFSHLPLMFEPNVGQTDPSVKFLARGAGYSLFLNSEGAVMALRRPGLSNSQPQVDILRMKLVGANPSANVGGTHLLRGKSNYFIGNDSSKWHRDVPHFANVRYEDVYPGINLVFYGNQGGLEYDFQVAPGADPSRAELEFEGSTNVELSNGALMVRSEDGTVRFEAPRVYQQAEERQQAVEGRFVMRAANRFGFEIGPYDHSRELIIDPQLNYSTYFGGSGNETAPSIAVDNVGNIYMAGSTTSANLLVSSAPLQGTLKGAQNVFILKLNPQAGTSGEIYSTYLGGSGTDTSVGIGVDGAGNVYVAGTTSSADFPTTSSNAYQIKPEVKGSQCTSTCTSVFVSELNPVALPASQLTYSSYLSGNGNDTASGMAIDNKGNVYVTGTTTSNDQASITNAFPAAGPPTAKQLPYQSFPFAPLQFFVTKVNTATGSGVFSVAYSTYFGGGTPTNASATGGGIAVDSAGNVYFTGTTNFLSTGNGRPPDFPILNAYQPCLDQPPPTSGTPPACTNTGSATDAFVAKLNLNPNVAPGSQLLWSTYLGGTQTDSSTHVALDYGAANGANVYITGTTNSPDVTALTTFTPYESKLNCPPPLTTCSATTTDAYVARFSNPTTGNMSLTYFSYLGGTGNDAGLAITVDTANGAVLTGWTQSPDFPVTAGAIQSALKGTQQNAFLARINTAATAGNGTVGSYVTYFGGTGVDQGTSVALDTNLSTYFAGDTTSGDIQTQAPLQANNKGGSDAFAVKLGTAADLAITGTLSLGTGQQYVSAGNQATFSYTVTNRGPDLATNITVTDNLSATGIPVTFISATATSGSCSQTATGNSTAVCTITSLQSGSTATVTVVLTPTAAGSFNGGVVSVSAANNTDPDLTNNSVSIPGRASDFTIGVSPNNQTIPAAGATAIYTVALTPVPVYPANISLSASGLPTASGFIFTPSNTVTGLPAGPSTATLNISTTARPVTVVRSRTSRGAIYALWLGIPGITLLGFGVGNNRRRKIAGVAVLCVLFGLLALQPACGGTKTPAVVSGTPAGTYTITVTATSGTLSHNTILTLTVP
jgi:uncharacterized repeat protein (TIGR01451 family)